MKYTHTHTVVYIIIKNDEAKWFQKATFQFLFYERPMHKVYILMLTQKDSLPNMCKSTTLSIEMFLINTLMYMYVCVWE